MSSTHAEDIIALKRIIERKPQIPVIVYDEKGVVLLNQKGILEYKSLNDVFPKGDMEVWYVKDESFHESYNFEVSGQFGTKKDVARGKIKDVPISELKKTHVLIGKIEGNPCDGSIFGELQGERWSPLGQARKMIEKLGTHTSMSVGDIVIKGSTGMLCATTSWVQFNVTR